MYGESVLRASEKVNIGLPAEYIPGVLKGLAFAEPLVSAFLDFRCGAHGEVGSNQIMFSAAANALMKILERDPDQLDDNFLAGLISGPQISAISGFRG
jgi:hypothetical protein